MYTQGLKSFVHVQVRCFILENIRQPYQKKNANTYVDIDELKVFRDLSSKDETILKTKKEIIDMVDKVNNKINNIKDINKIIGKIKDEVRNNIKSIFKKMFKLQDDPQLRQADLDNMDAKIDDALNFVWNKIFRKNKINSKKLIGVNIKTLIVM